MFRTLINAAVLVILFCTNLSAQWEWQNPQPNGNQLKSVTYVTENRLMAGGYTGTLLESDDGGSTWQNLSANAIDYEIGGGAHVMDIFFLDESTGWFITSGGSIYKTENGGRNWEINFIVVNVALFSINFFDEEKGWVVGKYGTIVKTTDGGETWDILGSLEENFLTPIIILNEERLVVGSSGGIYVSANSGETWIKKSTEPISSSSSESMFFIDETTGWAGADWLVGTILKTEDGGESWRKIQFDDVLYINVVHFVDAERGWVTGKDVYTGMAKIFKTSDGGENWSVIYEEYESNLLSVDFKDQNNGTVVGHGGRILQTTDGGDTWIDRTDGFYNSLTTVDFVDDQNGWAGGYNILLHTTDGGQTWSDNTFDKVIYIMDIDFVNENHGRFVGYENFVENNSISFRGVIYITIDGGASWHDRTPGQIPRLNALHFVGSYNGYAVGDLGTVLKTTDGGETWTAKNTSSERHVGAVYFLQTDIGFICGRNGLVAKTTDSGNSWQETTVGSGMPYFREIQFVNKDVGWIVDGNWGPLYRTTDGGQNWLGVENLTPDNVPISIESFHFFDENNGWAGGFMFGWIYKTNDGGVTWEVTDDLIWNRLTDMVFINENIGWVVGRDGAILKYTDLNVPITLPPERFVLSQNYPNPFNPVTTIPFDLPKNEHVTLRVYTITGKLVAELVNESRSAGFHNVQWDASNMASGVYIYTISAGGFSETKKMVVMK